MIDHNSVLQFVLATKELYKLMADCKDFLSKSLFIVGEFGGNDYSTALFFGRRIDEVSTFVPHVVSAISDGVEVSFGHIYPTIPPQVL